MGWEPKVGGVAGNIGRNASNEAKGAVDAVASGNASYFDPITRTEKLGGLIDGKKRDGKSFTDIFNDIISKAKPERLPELERMRNLSELKDKGVVAAPQVGRSTWLQMAMKKQTADQARGLDAGVQNQAQALAAGRAMNPRALMSGASENLSGQGLLDTVKMRQNMALQNAMGNAGVQMQGAGKETDLNQFNAGLKNQAAQVNISNSIQDLVNQNQNNAFKYGEKMKLKAADATSRGIAASGGGGGGKK